MTGYGAGIKSSENYKVTVELKSLNSKFLELAMKVPRAYMGYEHKLRNLLTEQIKRGKVNVVVEVEVLNPAKRNLNINTALVNSYLQELSALKDSLGISQAIDLQFLMSLPDVLPTENTAQDSEEWELIQAAFTEACTQLSASRTEEGVALEQDMRLHRDIIEAQLIAIETLVPERMAHYRNRLEAAIGEIRDRVTIDQNRFEQEIIFYLDKLDINEEIVRLRQHMLYFDDILKKDDDQGKKLGFVAQEMGREINTIGSKANFAAMQRHVVVMKNELDKIKEQSLNVL